MSRRESPYPDFPTPQNASEAKHLQHDLARQLRIEGTTENVETLAALDASVKGDSDYVAVAVLWHVADERILEVGVGRVPQSEIFPYVPGLLSFREAPAYLAALRQLSVVPDLLLADGQGYAHPRRLGLAAHLGVHCDLPAIGVAKKRLVGTEDGDLGTEKGCTVPLYDDDEQIGWVYRSRTNVKPVYVSPGHRVGMDAALAFVKSLPGQTKLPEPLRQAHHWAGRAREEDLSGRITVSKD
ncbi:MAG: endonuclease V [Trueperaceae bacterium]|nr:endonuclease V [Trueperaceae bacterium]